MFRWIRAVLASRPSLVEAKLADLKRVIFARPLSDAEQQVTAWLETGTGVVVVAEDVDVAVLASLPASALRLLSQFPRIEVGGVELGGSLASLEAGVSDKVLIGRDLEHAKVYVGMANEALWVVEPWHEANGEWPDPYPSISHYLLIVRETMQPDWWTKNFV